MSTRSLCLFIFLFIFSATSFCLFALESSAPIPKHLQSLKSKAITQNTVFNQQLLTTDNNTRDYRFKLDLTSQSIDIMVDKVSLNPSGSRSFSKVFKRKDMTWSVVYTQGENSGFGEIIGNGQHLLIEQRGEQVFAIDLALSGLIPGNYQDDVVNQLQTYATGRPAAKSAGVDGEIIIVDLMLLYTQNIVDTFPGGMTQTLLEHLVFKANQTFFDSQINMRLRLVHSEFVDYPKPSSLDALYDLADALENNQNISVLPSLANVKSLRDTYGADIVSMIRTHDLNEREVCGVAFFPGENQDYLINISNVGISGGSNCLDTFTHEIGHNFGAGHQRFNNEPQGAEAAAGAYIVSGKFNTMMSSIGTGDVNRDYGLAIFSNPNIICASVACGNVNVANNSATINNFAAQNAALRGARSEATVPSYLPSQIDHDGDGVFDKNDAFPFEPAETKDSDLDGVGDNQDAFVNDASEQFDTDQDGLGNNADADDDNDGFNDNVDALPLDPNENIDADKDGVGQNSDQLDQDFQESLDNDLDGIGDKNDLDDDNDGVPDYYQPTTLSQSEVWVVSAGSDNILRFDSQTGEFITELLQVDSGGFSFRSDAILSTAQQLYFIAFSDVLSFDRQTQTITKVIDRSQLNSNFPAHLLFKDNNRLLVNNGLAPSNLEQFNLAKNGNFLTGSTSDQSVLRDMLVVADNKLIVAQRSANSLLTFDLGNLSAAPQILSTQGLDKPEQLTTDPSGNLYVTNAGTKDISQFDSSGNYLGRFIDAGSGGLGQPSCLSFGPDGHLYVCSADTHQVLKFDGQTGAFLKVFIRSEAGGLNQPTSLVFAGLPQDQIRLDPRHDSDGDGVDNIDDAFALDSSETLDTDADGLGNNADLDDDNDSLPDTYESTNNLNPLDASDANQDADNDGSSNLAEYQAGTDPNDANSAPPTSTTAEPSSAGGSLNLNIMWLLCILLVSRQQWRKLSAA